jgi:hypothetical protein
LTALGISLVLGERAVLPPQGYGSELSTHPKAVCTVTGRLIACDLIVRSLFFLLRRSSAEETRRFDHPDIRADPTSNMRPLFQTSPPPFLSSAFPSIPFLGHPQLTCTGQIPLSQHLLPSFPSSINPSNRKIRVLPTTQIATGPDLLEPIEGGRMFAVGDCCETEAIMAGYSALFLPSPSWGFLRPDWATDLCSAAAWNQAGVAGANVLSLIRSSSSAPSSSSPSSPSLLDPPLEQYVPDSAAIKLTLGRRHYAIQTTEGEIKRGTDGKDDLGVDVQWTFLQNTTDDYSL